MDALTFLITGNANRALSFQGYWEFFANNDIYNPDSYTEYVSSENIYKKTNYIQGIGEFWTIVIDGETHSMPVYTQDSTKLELSYLDPNLYIGFWPKYASMVFNGIIKWNYMKGSNIYFVYSLNKSVNGTTFSGIGDLKDFLLFNDKKDWVEILRNQTFMIKIDYWFEK